MKKLICVLLTAAMLLCSFCGCTKKDAAISTGEIGVVKDEEFGNVYIDLTIDDYMITYYNYYRITKEEKPDKYEAILGNVYDFLYCLCDAEKGTDIESLDLKKGAEDYLRRGGLSEEQIQKIEGYISE